MWRLCGLSTSVAAAAATVHLAASLFNNRSSFQDCVEAAEAAAEDELMARGPQQALAGCSRTDVISDSTHASSLLRRQGLVRINECLSDTTVCKLIGHITAFLAESLDIVADVGVSPTSPGAWRRFGNVRRPTHRYDIKLLLEPTVAAAVTEALEPLRAVCTSALGAEAELFELAALISDPGAPRQALHPDTAYQPGGATVCTAFIALQDIDASMGPTVFLPGTHTDPDAHVALTTVSVDLMVASEDEGIRTVELGLEPDSTRPGEPGTSPHDQLLLSSPQQRGLLRAGDAILFDSRLLHCGSANTSLRRRVLFYVSFKAKGIVPTSAGTLDPEIKRCGLRLDEDVDTWVSNMSTPTGAGATSDGSRDA